MQNKKNIILDTDIGTDSDDIGALSILCNLYKNGVIEFDAISVASSFKESYLITDLILEHYGLDIPIGICDHKFKEDAQHGSYARAVTQVFKSRKKDMEPVKATKVLRKALLKGNITLITIGQLVNISNLLKSEPDEISPLSGAELFKKNVKEMYIMGGSFIYDMSEYNIVEDVKSSMDVINNTDIPKTFIPFEIGIRVKTGKNLLDRMDTPMGVGYYVHNITERESWDPITVYEAVYSNLEKSEYGKIAVTEDGKTIFEPGTGYDRYIKDINEDELKKKLNALMVA